MKFEYRWWTIFYFLTSILKALSSILYSLSSKILYTISHEGYHSLRWHWDGTKKNFWLLPSLLQKSQHIFMEYLDYNSVRARIESTIFDGAAMQNSIRMLFEYLKFNSDFIKQHGACCFDVGTGNEIVMLQPFQPSYLIVSEPVNHIFIGTWQEEGKQEILDTLGKSYHAQIIRDHWRKAMQEIQQRFPQKKFGLTSLLNMSPYYWNYPHIVEDFITNSGNLLVKGGLAVVSLVEQKYMKKTLLPVMNRGVKSFDIHLIENTWESHEEMIALGGSILTALKK